MSEEMSEAADSPAPPSYDAFVVYSTADREWVQGYLIPALGLGNDRVMTPEQFTLGQPIVREFQRGVTVSRFTVIVLTPAFLADEWALFGEQLASFASVNERRDRLVPVLLEPCELPLAVDFRVRLDYTDQSRWDNETTRLRDLLGQPEPPPEHLACPYPGMVPFRSEDARFFCGRDTEVTDLLSRVRRQALVAVIGPSGSGKSSLVYAGLLPALARVHGADVLVRSLRPGNQPMVALAERLEVRPGEALDPKAVLEAAARMLAAHPPSRSLLLVIDQLEEAFVQPIASDRDAFFAALVALRGVESVTLLLTMRADFYGDLMTSPLWPLEASERFEILPLRGDALREAIVRPAEEARVYVEPALVERLVADAAEEPGALPLAQETLVLLWQRREHRLLTLAAYETLGSEGRSGLAVALALTADAALAALPKPDRLLARRIFLRLVQLGEGREDTRRQQSVASLRPATGDGRFDDTLRCLTARRLVTLSGDEGEAASVDLAHEALIAGWPALRSWIEEDRGWLQVERRLSRDASDWEDLGRSPDLLYRGSRLVAAQEASAPHLDELTLSERDFLESGRLRAEQEAANALERAERDATSARREVEATLRRAAEAVAALLPIDPPRALVQAVVAVGQSLENFSGEVFAPLQMSLHAATSAAKERLVLTGHEAPVRSVAISDDERLAVSGGDDRTVRLWDMSNGSLRATLTGHEDFVAAVALSRDGKLVASAGGDGAVRLWSVDGDPLETFRGHEGFVGAVVFGPDGRWLASAGDDGAVRIWDVDDSLLAVHTSHVGWVAALAVSPDDGTVASGGSDGTIRVWEASLTREVLAFDDDVITALAFGPHGLLASAGGDGSIRLWGDRGAPVADFRAHDGVVLALAFDATGLALASAGGDHTARLWDLNGNPIHAPLIGHTAPLRSVAVSSTGDTIVTAAGDGTVRVWDWQRVGVASPLVAASVVSRGAAKPGGSAATAARTAVLRWDAEGDQVGPAWIGHDDGVTGVAFGLGGRTVLSVGADRSLRVWDLAGRSVLTVDEAHQASVMAVGVTVDGTVITGGRDGVVRLWDVYGNCLATSNERTGDVMAVAANGAGTMVVSGTLDGTARIWDLRGTLLATCHHGDDVLAVAVGAGEDGIDTEIVATGGKDGTVRLFSVAGKSIGPVITGFRGAVHSVAIAQNGQMIAAGGEDRTVRVWDRDGTPRGEPIEGHAGPVRSVRFGVGDKSLFTAGDDGTLRLWDLRGNPVARPLRGHQGPVLAAAISSDGRLAVTGGKDTTVRLWRAGAWRQWAAVACERLKLHPVLDGGGEAAVDFVDVCKRLRLELEGGQDK